jgi:hypothetical protein
MTEEMDSSESAIEAGVLSQVTAEIPLPGNPVAVICDKVPSGLSVKGGLCGGPGLWYAVYGPQMVFQQHRQSIALSPAMTITPLYQKKDGRLRVGPRVMIGLAQKETSFTLSVAPAEPDPVIDAERQAIASKLWAEDVAVRAAALGVRAEDLTQQAMTRRNNGISHRNLGMEWSRRGAALRHQAITLIQNTATARDDHSLATATATKTMTQVLAHEGRCLLEAARILRRDSRRDLSESARLAHSAAMIAGAALRLRGEANEAVRDIASREVAATATNKTEILTLPLAGIIAPHISQDDNKSRSILIEGLPPEVILSEGIEDPLRQRWIVPATKAAGLELKVPLATPSFLLTLKTVSVTKGVAVDGDKRQLRIVVPTKSPQS